jgi:hypothetical protein
MPKFNMTSTKYKVTFQNLDIRGIPNTWKVWDCSFSPSSETLQNSWNLQTSCACQYNVQK